MAWWSELTKLPTAAHRTWPLRSLFSRRAILICPLHRVVEEEIDLDLELFCGRGRESIIEWGVVCDEWGSVQIWSRLAPGDHLLLYLLTSHRTVSLQMQSHSEKMHSHPDKSASFGS